MKWIRLAHMIRWILELLILGLGVLPETGIWTTFTLFMITLELEYLNINPRHWERLA